MTENENKMRPLRLALLALPVACALALAPSCFSPDYPTTGFYCHPDDSPACPDGQTCVGIPPNARCQTTGGTMKQSGSIVTKSSSYTGLKMDPGLNDETMCSDAPLEPNDSIDHAVTGLNQQLNLIPDAASPKLQMLAICPKGDNPKADGHDRDYYEIVADQSVSAVVEIFYDIKYGDLDVGIFRQDGSIVAGDGTAVSNGCVAATLPAGKYYIGVGGANDMDSNRYDLRVRYYSSPKTCGSMGNPDLGG